MARASSRGGFALDVGIVALLALVVLGFHFGSALLRPSNAPELDLRPVLLPLYVLRSLARLAVAYVFAVLIALAVGHLAARSPAARRLILPLLDVLQSVPILGFFPAAVSVFIVLFGGSALGVEAAAVFLIFTSMFWNLAFAVYENLLLIPEDLNLAARQFGLQGQRRWRRLLLPVVAPTLVYNSILSWANGWYFLMASEIIAAGPARYTLPGLGSYLAQAIATGHQRQMLLALLALLVVTTLMHVLLWGPLETWAERFHLDEVGNRPRTPVVGRILRRSGLVRFAARRLSSAMDSQALAIASHTLEAATRLGALLPITSGVAVAAGLAYAAYRTAMIVLAHPFGEPVAGIPLDLLLSFLRVGLGVALAVALSLPLAYLTFRRAAVRGLLLSALQVLGSVPASAFFPLIALVLVRFGLGMNVGSVLLVLTGTFFYVMFNVLSGAAAIPRELDEAAAMLGLRGRAYLQHVFVPAVLPSLVTGCITAWGGGWNAIIFSEYVLAAGVVHSVRGIGATLDRATYVSGDLQVVALCLMAMVALIVAVNRVFWDRAYRHVTDRYKMEV